MGWQGTPQGSTLSKLHPFLVPKGPCVMVTLAWSLKQACGLHLLGSARRVLGVGSGGTEERKSGPTC